MSACLHLLQMLRKYTCMHRQVHVYVGVEAGKRMDDIPRSLTAAFKGYVHSNQKENIVSGVWGHHGAKTKR